MRAAERLERELAAWSGAPVFAYGFDDLSPAQLRLIGALAGRCDVLLALPYEPGRPLLGSLDVAFEWLAARAERVEELRAAAYGRPRAWSRWRAARSRRAASRRRPRTAPCGWSRPRAADGEATAVAAEVCRLLRLGLAADEVLVVAPDGYDCEPLAGGARARGGGGGPRYERAPHEPARGARAARLCRVAWADGDRDDLFAWLRLAGSSWARLARARVGGEAARPQHRRRARAERELWRRPAAARARADGAARAADPAAALRAVADAALARAYGDAPVAAETRMGVAARRALAAASAPPRSCPRALPGAGGDDVLAALDAVQVRLGDGLPRGRVRIVRIGLARLAPVRAVVLCGLEAGRAAAPRAGRGRRLGRSAARADAGRPPGDRPRQEERDRFLFAAALARVDEHLVLVRRAVDDDGLELAPSPFWDEVVRVLGERRAGVTPPAHALDGHDERERLQAIAAVARHESPGGARCERARTAGGRSPASSARSRRGGGRRVCGTPRCSRAWRLSRPIR